MSIDQLRSTVARMEAGMRADPAAAALMRVYELVAVRFDADLEAERDALLSRGAALMLVAELLEISKRSAAEN